jgi:RimJ/RimL family protein N-acetyltransferase
MSRMELPPLNTGRLVIRPFTLADLDDVYRIIDCDCFGRQSLDDEAAKRRRRDWLEWNLLGFEQQAVLGHPPYGERAITLKGDGRLIGVCGLVPSFGPFRRLLDGDDRCRLNSPEIGLFYAVASPYRRMGCATEAAAALLEVAFETLRVRRVVATTEAQNQASISVMRRLGMAIIDNSEPGWPQVVGCRYGVTGPCERSRQEDAVCPG